MFNSNFILLKKFFAAARGGSGATTLAVFNKFMFGCVLSRKVDVVTGSNLAAPTVNV